MQKLSFPAPPEATPFAQWIGVVCAGLAQSSGCGSGHSGRSMHAFVHLLLHIFLHFLGF